MEIPAAYDEKFKDVLDLGGFEEGQVYYLDAIEGKKRN